MDRLRGRRVFVGGVGPGLGSAVVYLALSEGAGVYAAARSRDFLERLRREFSRFGELHIGAYDLSRPEGAEAAVADAATKLGGLDGVVVTAGGYAETPIEELDPSALEDLLSRNLKAHLYVVKAATKHLKPGSSIVLVTAVGGAYPAWLRRNVAYVASKAALARAVESLAAELIDKGIRVNGVAPGGMSKDFTPGGAARRPPLGAPQAPPEEVARVVIWLLADESYWVNGAVIPADGGRRLA
ncbi:SDR family NAD(P)-dependent oxidoreductase [Pyrobaculum ferrireducens]|uniref:3-ketoacyl-(Acyl-carrier-protein) reductase n=1 Tax=Pyrobaculum ferrireducens TaxID=1104324 RepID=G7VHM4_9CREN|nr:SDR family NAD(P)-dependent oxidoreductase [Pyrobaculum ferrireducens]AET33315.1 3-ketoacyl-(acyl-carrier-protein) reductase [Pyrobaculum ferrireducens]